jgi:hypothetical protein
MAVERVASLFDSSRLAKLDLVDRTKLLKSYADFVSTGRRGREDWFMEAAVLEATIRALEHAGAVPGFEGPGSQAVHVRELHRRDKRL